MFRGKMRIDLDNKVYSEAIRICFLRTVGEIMGREAYQTMHRERGYYTFDYVLIVMIVLIGM